MTKNFSDNRDLILYLKKGNASAYTYLVDKYNRELCLYANSLINDIIISEDIVQNVFIKVWEKRNNLKTSFSIKNYLYKSVYNACINEYKRNKSVSALEKKYIEELDRITEDKNDDASEKLIELVRGIIYELPPKCREILLLSKKEGLTYAEISKYLSISKSTIERQINIAFSKIRKSIKNR